jgi:hypothetical protein
LAASAAAVDVKALKRVDFPTFGNPTIPQLKPISATPDALWWMLLFLSKFFLQMYFLFQKIQTQLIYSSKYFLYFAEVVRHCQLMY